MEKIMNPENLRSFAYVNNSICAKPIKGIVLNFTGLGNQNIHTADMDAGQYYGERGILYVIPYNNPWCWMNRQAVAYTDEIVDVLVNAYSLRENIPIVSSGGSMGGLSSLVYMVYAKRTPVACVANCPVCDAVYHYTERKDLPRTMYSALYNEPGDLQTALRTISPIHLIDRMPRVKYHIFHCGNDMSVNLHRHSEPFMEQMRRQGHDITFDLVPDRGHCDLTYQMKKRYADYIVDAIESAC